MDWPPLDQLQREHRRFWADARSLLQSSNLEAFAELDADEIALVWCILISNEAPAWRDLALSVRWDAGRVRKFTLDLVRRLAC